MPASVRGDSKDGNCAPLGHQVPSSEKAASGLAARGAGDRSWAWYLARLRMSERMERRV